MFSFFYPRGKAISRLRSRPGNAILGGVLLIQAVLPQDKLVKEEVCQGEASSDQKDNQDVVPEGESLSWNWNAGDPHHEKCIEQLAICEPVEVRVHNDTAEDVNLVTSAWKLDGVLVGEVMHVIIVIIQLRGQGAFSFKTEAILVVLVNILVLGCLRSDGFGTVQELIVPKFSTERKNHEKIKIIPNLLFDNNDS